MTKKTGIVDASPTLRERLDNIQGQMVRLNGEASGLIQGAADHLGIELGAAKGKWMYEPPHNRFRRSETGPEKEIAPPSQNGKSNPNAPKGTKPVPETAELVRLPRRERRARAKKSS